MGGTRPPYIQTPDSIVHDIVQAIPQFLVTG